MGKRGPRPKPDALKKFEGTYRADRSAPGALELPAGVPPCPAGMAADAAAIWMALVADERWRIVLSRVDALGLEMLAKHMALERRYEAEASLRPVVKTPYGPKPNPAASEARKEAALVKQLLAEFGLTPSARRNVSTKPDKGPTAPAADGVPLIGAPLRVVNGGAGGDGG
jgi:phage terminase small subunit